MKWIKYLPLALKIASFIYSQFSGKNREEIKVLVSLFEEMLTIFVTIFNGKDEVTKDMLVAELRSMVEGQKEFEEANA